MGFTELKILKRRNFMNFKEAFKAMKNGAKVKLPGWNGYWCWMMKNIRL